MFLLAIGVGVVWLAVLVFCLCCCIAAAREDRLRERLAQRAKLELVTLERQEMVDDYEDYRGI
jgi:hypothetical protein